MSDTHPHSVAFVRTEASGRQAAPKYSGGPCEMDARQLVCDPCQRPSDPHCALRRLSGSEWRIALDLNGVWDSPSLKVCREILHGETGACFAVLTERWTQLSLDSNTRRNYWRPRSAFVLLFLQLRQCCSLTCHARC